MQDGDKVVGSWETRRDEIKEGVMLILCLFMALNITGQPPDCEAAVCFMRKSLCFYLNISLITKVNVI